MAPLNWVIKNNLIKGLFIKAKFRKNKEGCCRTPMAANSGELVPPLR